MTMAGASIFLMFSLNPSKIDPKNSPHKRPNSLQSDFRMFKLRGPGAKGCRCLISHNGHRATGNVDCGKETTFYVKNMKSCIWKLRSSFVFCRIFPWSLKAATAPIGSVTQGPLHDWCSCWPAKHHVSSGHHSQGCPIGKKRPYVNVKQLKSRPQHFALVSWDMLHYIAAIEHAFKPFSRTLAKPSKPSENTIRKRLRARYLESK